MGRYERHLFVCENERPPGHPRGCCSEKGSRAIREALKSELKRFGLAGRMRANMAGCLDTCEFGPCIVVYPDNVWYGGVSIADVAEIIESHLQNGQPVRRLLIAEESLRPPAGKDR